MENSSFIQFQRPTLQNLLNEWNVVKDTKVMSQSLTCVRSWRCRMCWTEQSLGTGHTWLPRHVPKLNHTMIVGHLTVALFLVFLGNKECSLKTHMENTDRRQKCTRHIEYIWHKGPLVFGLLEQYVVPWIPETSKDTQPYRCSRYLEKKDAILAHPLHASSPALQVIPRLHTIPKA